MQKVSVRETREQISRLLDAVEAGEEVIILRRGKPTARLVAVSHAATATVQFPDRTDFRAQLPRARRPTAELVREMRDERG
jgi:prevent-host-death family protein